MHYFLDFYNISSIFSCNIPEDPIFTTVYFFDMRAVRIRNGKALTTINSILMDNSIRKTPKEYCLPLVPLYESLEGHHSYTDTYCWSQRCVSEIPTPCERKQEVFFYFSVEGTHTSALGVGL